MQRGERCRGAGSARQRVFGIENEDIRAVTEQLEVDIRVPGDARDRNGAVTCGIRDPIDELHVVACEQDADGTERPNFAGVGAHEIDARPRIGGFGMTWTLLLAATGRPWSKGLTDLPVPRDRRP